MKLLLILLLIYLEMWLTVTQELWWDNTVNQMQKENTSNLQFQEDQGDQCHLFHPTNEIKSIFYTMH